MFEVQKRCMSLDVLLLAISSSADGGPGLEMEEEITSTCGQTCEKIPSFGTHQGLQKLVRKLLHHYSPAQTSNSVHVRTK